MEWTAAERGELNESLMQSSSAAQGGGDVSRMLVELGRIVRLCKRDPADEGLKEAAWTMGASIQACLRPPTPATLTKVEQREFRALVQTLERLSTTDSAAEESKEASSSTSRRTSNNRHHSGHQQTCLEMAEAGQFHGHGGGNTAQASSARAQLVLQEDLGDAYDRELEEERQRAITNITEQVSTVNQIYRDIAGLVTTQQTEIDEIETLVAASHARTTKGQRQLEQAVRRRKTKNKCCCYCAVFLTVFAVILVLAIIGFKNIAPYLAR